MLTLSLFTAFLFMCIGLVIYDAIRPDNGRGQSLNWNRLNGKWRVLYSDGKYSQPFTRAVASDYAELFDGKVVPSSAYQPQEMASGKDN